MYAAVFTGANYSAPNHDEHSIEVHDSMEDAVDSLLERYEANGQYPIEYRTLDGENHAYRMPCVEQFDRLDLYLVEHEPPVSALDESVVMDVLTSVHNGVQPDAVLTLVLVDGKDAMIVAVER